MQKRYERWVNYIIALFLFFMAAIAFVNLMWPEHGFYSFLGFFHGDDHAMQNLHNGGLVILTAGLVGAAWYQLQKLNTTSTADFLLRIDERFGSGEVIKARLIIHKLYLEAKEDIKNSTEYETDSEEQLLEKRQRHISKNILKIKDSSVHDDPESFIYLLNFLDLLEVAAFYCNKNYITLEAINELSGDSIKYYYGVYEGLIQDRQCRRGPSHFSEVTILVQKIKNSDKDNKQPHKCFFCA